MYKKIGKHKVKQQTHEQETAIQKKKRRKKNKPMNGTYEIISKKGNKEVKKCFSKEN